MGMARFLTIVGVLALVFGGCSPGSPQQGQSDTSTGGDTDTGDPGSGETVQPDAPDAPGPDPDEGPVEPECTETADCADKEDGDLCNGTLICFEELCRLDADSIVECPAGDDPCVEWSCGPATGECTSTVLPDCGSECEEAFHCADDDNACTEPECVDGACAWAAVDCDDSDECTLESCQPAVGCVYEVAPDCQEAGVCEPQETIDCAQGWVPFVPGGQNGISEYGCASGMIGGEAVYSLSPAADTTLFMDVYAEPFEGTVLMLLEGECSSDACLIASSSPFEGLQLEAQLEGGKDYFIVIDTAEDAPVLVFDGYVQCAQPEICDDFYDNDLDGPADCADSDCAGIGDCEASESTCDDGFDNDGDGLVDCADSTCAGDGVCEAQEITCDDGIDNDGDGLADCDDANCLSLVDCSAECEAVTAVLACGEKIDGDGAFPDEPPPFPGEPPQPGSGGAQGAMSAYSCSGSSFPGGEVVYEMTAEADGVVRFEWDAEPWGSNTAFVLEESCDSTACIASQSAGFGGAALLEFDGQAGFTYFIVVDSNVNQPVFVYGGSLQCAVSEDCTNGEDDDWDGKADCADVDCLLEGDPCEEIESACDDGFDNDGDGFIDCIDANCVLGGDPCELNEETCDDGLDNDGDGAGDCADVDCAQEAFCEAIEISCDDELDNDGDGFVDCADGNCSLVGDCPASCGGSAIEVKCGGGGLFGNSNGQNLLEDYPCAPQSYPGDEVVFTFVPEQSGFMFVDAFGEPFGQTSIFLLKGQCDAALCEASSVMGEFGEETFLQAEVEGGVPYFVVVDSKVSGPVQLFEGFLDCPF